MECLDTYDVACCDEDVVAWLNEGVVACLDKNNKDDFDVDFLLANPLEYHLGETLGRQCIVHHGYMKKIVWYETYVQFFMTIAIKTQLSTKHTWIMGGRGDGMRHISNYPINMNNLAIILKDRVYDILRPTSTSFTITPTMTSFIFINTIIHMDIITRYT